MGQDDDLIAAADTKILTLAAEIAESTDRSVPTLLLQLDGVLNSVEPGTRISAKMKRSVWDYDLFQVLTLVLKQDFSRVTGSWETAAKLANLLSSCCTGLDPPEGSNFHDVVLPQATENILVLARRLQDKYNKSGKGGYLSKEDLFNCFKTTVEALNLLYSTYSDLTINVFQLPWLLQLLITDDKETAIVMEQLIGRLMRVNNNVVNMVDEKVLHSILDELIYKLAISNDVDVANAGIKVILNLCDYHPPTVEILHLRYKGLKLLLTKWSGRGFNKDLKVLITLLEAGSAQRAKMEEYHQAAIIIQANWRSHNVRNKLKKANISMAKFHRIYRLRKVRKEKAKVEERLEEDLRQQLIMARKRSMRELRQKQLEVLEIIPAGQVSQHLAREQAVSATRIQARWRGYQERKKLAGRFDFAGRTKAAITVQRGIRKWLNKLEAKRKEPLAFMRPPGLTDERRVEIQNQILEWREVHQPKARTRDEQVEHHDNAQAMIQRHLLRSQLSRKSDQRREALLARLQIDSHLMLNAPKLPEATEKDLEVFVCRSIPVATKAQMNHIDELKQRNYPWWKKLGDEFQEPGLEETDYLF